jgi:hypothetical protein
MANQSNQMTGSAQTRPLKQTNGDTWAVHTSPYRNPGLNILETRYGEGHKIAPSPSWQQVDFPKDYPRSGPNL